jgi:acetyltransferase-like isoleucine patch superfamily enzyme
MRRIKFILSLLTYLYPFQISKIIKKIYKVLYTQWILHKLPNSDIDISINKGLHLVGGKYIKIENKVCIGRYVTLTARDQYLNNKVPSIVIGKGTTIGDFAHITAIDSILIGKDVLLGKFVTITDNNHGESTYESLCEKPTSRPMSVKGEVVIGDNVWIGDKSTILSGVQIGDSCIIAANSVVTKSLPSFCIAAGNPCKILKIIDKKNIESE